MPESPADLDLLLVTVAKPRLVWRDFIRLMVLRDLASALAPFVGKYVTVRYDPRDLAEVRVFHKNRPVCLAICPNITTEAVTLADIQAARGARRQALRREIDRLADLLREGGGRPAPACKPPAGPKPRLRIYQVDD